VRIILAYSLLISTMRLGDYASYSPSIFSPCFPDLFGTSAARRLWSANVSAMALVREGETLLFECGEGTQRQMMRYGVSFALSEIFFTHFTRSFSRVTG